MEKNKLVFAVVLGVVLLAGGFVYAGGLNKMTEAWGILNHGGLANVGDARFDGIVGFNDNIIIEDDAQVFVGGEQAYTGYANDCEDYLYFEKGLAKCNLPD